MAHPDWLIKVSQDLANVGNAIKKKKERERNRKHIAFLEL